MILLKVSPNPPQKKKVQGKGACQVGCTVSLFVTRRRAHTRRQSHVSTKTRIRTCQSTSLQFPSYGITSCYAGTSTYLTDLGEVTLSTHFFAVPVSSTLAAACVVPDVDRGRDSDDFRPGRRVLYTPGQVEFFGGSDWFLPDERLTPEPTQEQLDSVGEYEHVSSSESSDDDSGSLKSESEPSSEKEDSR